MAKRLADRTRSVADIIVVETAKPDVDIGFGDSVLLPVQDV
jgi:hypothetical protein